MKGQCGSLGADSSHGQTDNLVETRLDTSSVPRHG